MAPLLEVRNLTVSFPGSKQQSAQPTVAVREISFSVDRGGVLGLVGESGSGKSLTALSILQLFPAGAMASGEILYQGEAGTVDLLKLKGESLRRVRGSRISMIFQEPMTALNPVMRVGDQIAEAILAHHSIGKREAWRRAIEAMNEVAISEPEGRARSYPHQLSGGQRQRVMIAMAIANRPELIIADEPTTALDVTIQAQILELLDGLRQKLGMAMLFISHDLAVVSQVADRVAVMYAGSLVELGSKHDVFFAPAHPYTRGLKASVPTLRSERGVDLPAIPGMAPSAHAISPGCPFEPRCEWRVAECQRGLPPLVEVGAGHWARCPVINQK